MARPRKTLEKWILEAITDTDKDGPCSMISLMHMVGQQSKELHTCKFSGTKHTESDLAEMFRGKAEAYCQDLPGVQTFQLQAFYGKSQSPQAFQPFTINVNAAESSNGLYTEPPTQEGRLQMSMRREEMLIQQVYRRQQVMDEYSLRLIELQGNQIAKLTQENGDAFNIVKEMMMERIASDNQQAMSHAKFVRETEERKKWMSYAPLLINTLLGREVFPQNSADTVLVEAIADSLSDEDVMKLGSALKPELIGPLMGRFEVYQKKKLADAQARESLKGFTPDNEYNEETPEPKKLPSGKKKTG